MEMPVNKKIDRKPTTVMRIDGIIYSRPGTPGHRIIITKNSPRGCPGAVKIYVPGR
jgi:hypothetical protein